MGKKLYSTNKWRRRIREAQSRELKKLQNERSNRGVSPHQRVASELRYRHLHAPSIFSLIKNPEGTIKFLNQIGSSAQNKNIDLNIFGVSDLTPDAIAAMTATIVRPNFDDRKVRGNLPEDLSNQQMLVDSGFFNHVKTRVRLPKVINQGIITQLQSQQVESNTAAELIHQGTQTLYGEVRISKPAYRILIEAMGNTLNHAARNLYKKETWWTSVYVDTTRQRICYSFVDTGVGIFGSVKIKNIKRFYNAIVGRTDADILRDMLEDKVESSTGLPYRGRGLPSMNKLWLRGDLKKLVIVTNGVYADISENNFHLLTETFHGTLLYWEI